jgi:hypothetical protein
MEKAVEGERRSCRGMRRRVEATCMATCMATNMATSKERVAAGLGERGAAVI